MGDQYSCRIGNRIEREIKPGWADEGGAELGRLERGTWDCAHERSVSDLIDAGSSVKTKRARAESEFKSGRLAVDEMLKRNHG